MVDADVDVAGANEQVIVKVDDELPLTAIENANIAKNLKIRINKYLKF